MTKEKTKESKKEGPGGNRTHDLRKFVSIPVVFELLGSSKSDVITPRPQDHADAEAARLVI